jgi:drug/metabolite transporter (DMT)-like permease
MKMGANRLGHVELAPVAILLAFITNIHLVAGIALYGVFTFLLVLALRDGELSLLYPVIALNYVWVTVLSLLLFKETMNPFKAMGIFAIMIGVMVLGRGARK